VTRTAGYGRRGVGRVDHVILAVADLDRAAARVEATTGLASVPGGVHPGFGTANRVVPVGGGAYVELMAVQDPALAARTPVGQWVARACATGDALAGWMVAPDDLVTTARRIGAEVVAGERQLPDGTDVRWRLAGIETMLRDPPLPAFIAWDVPGDRHPSAMAVEHAVRPAGVGWVEVAGDGGRLRDWLAGDGGAADVRTVCTPGPPGLRAVGIALHGGGEVVLR
jgi:hypothetical protein